MGVEMSLSGGDFSTASGYNASAYLISQLANSLGKYEAWRADAKDGSDFAAQRFLSEKATAATAVAGYRAGAA